MYDVRENVVRIQMQNIRTLVNVAFELLPRKRFGERVIDAETTVRRFTGLTIASETFSVHTTYNGIRVVYVWHPNNGLTITIGNEVFREKEIDLKSPVRERLKNFIHSAVIMRLLNRKYERTGQLNETLDKTGFDKHH